MKSILTLLILTVFTAHTFAANNDTTMAQRYPDLRNASSESMLPQEIADGVTFATQTLPIQNITQHVSGPVYAIKHPNVLTGESTETVSLIKDPHHMIQNLDEKLARDTNSNQKGTITIEQKLVKGVPVEGWHVIGAGYTRTTNQ